MLTTLLCWRTLLRILPKQTALRMIEFQDYRTRGPLVGCCKDPSLQPTGSLHASIWRCDLAKSPACCRTRRSSTIGVDLPNQFQLFNIYSMELRGEPSMNRNNDRGIAYIVCLAILMTAGFATTAYSQQSKPKAAPFPKYSRDWASVVQKIVWTFDANRMMKI